MTRRHESRNVQRVTSTRSFWQYVPRTPEEIARLRVAAGDDRVFFYDARTFDRLASRNASSVQGALRVGTGPMVACGGRYVEKTTRHVDVLALVTGRWVSLRVTPASFPDEAVMVRVGSRWLALSDGDCSTVETREREPYERWVRTGNFARTTLGDPGVAYARHVHLNARRFCIDLEMVRTDGQPCWTSWVKP